MKRLKIAVAVLGTAASLLVPGLAPAAGEIVTNPFGNLKLDVLTAPTGTDPGTARLTIVTANGAVTSDAANTAYFGLRVMGGEDVEMTGFRLVGGNASQCTISDFAGNNTPNGWQGNDVFGTAAPGIGSANGHMRMIGGFLKKSCGNLEIDVTFRARPLAVFYAAFFGLEPAPWHGSYDQAPFDTIPTGGDSRYEKWWNLWGTFDTLGYSNACTSTTGTGAGNCG